MAEINLKNIPDDLHRELKSRAALDGTTLREFIFKRLFPSDVLAQLRANKAAGLPRATRKGGAA